MITYTNIVNRFEAFVAANPFVQTFSFGSPSDVDLDKLEIVPVLHLVYTGASYGKLQDLLVRGVHLGQPT